MFMKRFKIKDPEKLPQFLVPGTPEAEIPNEISPLSFINKLVVFLKRMKK